MDKRKQKKMKRYAAAYKKPAAPCPRCGRPGQHFVPPSFGDPGFYACEAMTSSFFEKTS
jgi:hypothetical protein